MSDLSSSSEGGSVGDVNAEFTFGTRLGIVFIIEGAFLSLAAVLGLLLYIGFAAIKQKRKRRWQWSMSTPLHVYFISLLIAEIFQATGAIMNIKWAQEASVDEGAFCVAQGIVKQIGDVSVALCTLAIAVHTFAAIVFRWSPARPRLLSALVLSAIWLIVTLIIVISAVVHRNNIDDYWSETQYWCWIAKPHKIQQYLLDYVFMWATAFANIVLYVPMALVIKGVITVKGWQVRYRRAKERKHISAISSVVNGRGVDKVALQMLFYPAVYTLTILPIAIVRFRAFHDEHVPFVYTAIADVLFVLSGFFNVCLFGYTRPSLLPRRETHVPSSQTLNAFSFSLRGPSGDQHISALPSILSPRSPMIPMSAMSGMTSLPDDSIIYRFDSRSERDCDDHSLQLTPKPPLTPSVISFHTHSPHSSD